MSEVVAAPAISSTNVLFVYRPNGTEVQVNATPLGVTSTHVLSDDEIAALMALKPSAAWGNLVQNCTEAKFVKCINLPQSANLKLGNWYRVVAEKTIYGQVAYRVKNESGVLKWVASCNFQTE